MRSAALSWAFALFAGALAAQNGDRSPDDKRDVPPGIVVPPATVRSPAEALETFRLQPGYRIELCAAEPLVRDPVVATFDAAGRLWVAEMNTFMRDIDATGELEPRSRVTVLHDDDGDGRMDRATPFLADVVLPRAVLPLDAGRPGGGALVILPPKLCWALDRDGDLVADELVDVAEGFDAGLQNPEHSGNSLLWGRDNRIHLANDRRVWRCERDAAGALRFVEESGAGGGQWGLSQDDRGRLWFNYNSDWLRCDLVPGRYADRAPDLRMAGLSHRAVGPQDVYPVRVTPGVNRGGRAGTLDAAGVLASTTAVCAPLYYRGDALDDCRDSVFVCEPAGHVVRRFVLDDGDARLAARNPYERAEFLASTDERFRPVNLQLGPDGALYIVDMYRGVIQHKNFVTTYLRKQVLARGLEQPIGMGRIWRVVRAGAPTPPARTLDGAATGQLVAALLHGDGWLRDTAQRLLVLRDDRSAVPMLRAALRSNDDPGARIAVLAVLDGMRALSTNDLRAIAYADDPGLLAFAIGHVGRFLQGGDPVLFAHCERWAAHAAPTVRWHLALALGEVTGTHAQRASALCASLAVAAAEDPVLRDCVANAVAGSEPGFVGALAATPGFGEACAPLLQTLGQLVARTRKAERQEALLTAAAACMHTFAQRALLRGFVSALPKEPDKRRGWFTFAATPQSLPAMKRIGDAGVGALVDELLAAIAIRPEAMAASGPDDDELSFAERGRIAAGARVYGAICAACHQADGRGMAGLAPPLRDSEWVGGSDEVLLKIVLSGVRGPIEAAGVAFDGEMPSQAHFSDDDLAAALSWLRRAWGARGASISPEAVAAARARYSGRDAWTAAELAR